MSLLLFPTDSWRLAGQPTALTVFPLCALVLPAPRCAGRISLDTEVEAAQADCLVAKATRDRGAESVRWSAPHPFEKARGIETARRSRLRPETRSPRSFAWVCVLLAVCPGNDHLVVDHGSGDDVGEAAFRIRSPGVP